MAIKICEKGHRFEKSSNCPVCPICESEKKPESGFLSMLSAPARRALEREGILTLENLSTYSPAQLLALHGLGKASIPILEKELKTAGLSFAS